MRGRKARTASVRWRWLWRQKPADDTRVTVPVAPPIVHFTWPVYAHTVESSCAPHKYYCRLLIRSRPGLQMAGRLHVVQMDLSELCRFNLRSLPDPWVASFYSFQQRNIVFKRTPFTGCFALLVKKHMYAVGPASKLKPEDRVVSARGSQ